MPAARQEKRGAHLGGVLGGAGGEGDRGGEDGDGEADARGAADHE